MNYEDKLYKLINLVYFDYDNMFPDKFFNREFSEKLKNEMPSFYEVLLNFLKAEKNIILSASLIFEDMRKKSKP